MLTSFGLCQHVNFDTHMSANILDVVITKIEQPMQVTNCTKGPLLSDHFAVETTIEGRKPDLIRKTSKSRPMKQINWIEFKSDVSKVTASDHLSLEEVDQQLTAILNKHAPIKEKSITLRRRYPWFSEKVAEDKQQMR
jgi:hypothetical protein